MEWCTSEDKKESNIVRDKTLGQYRKKLNNKRLKLSPRNLSSQSF